MIEVIVTMRAREGKEDELRAFLLAIVVESRQEKGNLRYQLLIGDDDPREFAIHAQWENAAALNAHLRSKPVGFAHTRMPELTDAPPRIVAYGGVEPAVKTHSGPTSRLDPESSHQ
jgi:quinol monooxygenase YgiN